MFDWLSIWKDLLFLSMKNMLFQLDSWQSTGFLIPTSTEATWIKDHYYHVFALHLNFHKGNYGRKTFSTNIIHLKFKIDTYRQKQWFANASIYEGPLRVCVCTYVTLSSNMADPEWDLGMWSFANVPGDSDGGDWDHALKTLT